MFSLICLVISIVYFFWKHPERGTGDRPVIVVKAQEEINNQITRAKDRLYETASEYVNNIEHFYNAIVQKKTEHQMRKIFCPSIEGATGQSCPPSSLHLDPITHISIIENAAAQLAVGMSQFQIDVYKIRYQACKEIGYLCLPKEDNRSFLVLWKDLPSTEFDETILQAIDLLPKTQPIIKAILTKYQ